MEAEILCTEDKSAQVESALLSSALRLSTRIWNQSCRKGTTSLSDRKPCFLLLGDSTTFRRLYNESD